MTHHFSTTRSPLSFALIAGLLAAATAGANAQTESSPSAKRSRPAVQIAEVAREETVRPELSTASYSTYCTVRTYGSRIIRCPDWRINANSRVFASLSEYTIAGPTDRWMGSARMTMHNIRPFNGGFDAWINVEWGSPLNIRVDVLVDP